MSTPITTAGRRVLGYLADLLWLVFVAFLFPAVILVVGTPVALVARLVAEIWQRW